MNQESFLKELGRSYIVSAFFPSAFFVSVGILLFRGFIPASLENQFWSNKLDEWGSGQWVISVVLILWVAFLLYSANDVTVKFFEGYLMPDYLRRFLKWILQSWRFSKATKEYDAYLKLDAKLSKIREKGKTPSRKFFKKHHEQYRKARRELQEHEINAPFEYDNVLPFRLGNVLRASEMYANDRYYIEGLTIWPRLLPLMPKAFTAIMEEQHNHLMFLLNSALLAYINALISFGIVAFGHWFPKNIFLDGNEYISIKGFFYIGIVFSVFGYRLYKVGVNVAESLGFYLRSAYDLYREDLLRQLNWKLPNTLDEEKELWESICLFYSTGDKLKEIDFPDYYYYDKDGNEIKTAP